MTSPWVYLALQVIKNGCFLPIQLYADGVTNSMAMLIKSYL